MTVPSLRVRDIGGRLVGIGHSYNYLGAPSERVFVNRLASQMGGASLVNLAVSGATLVLGDPAAGRKGGGFATVAQYLQRGANQGFNQPSYSPPIGVFAITTGLNDAGQIYSMSAGNQTTATACYKDTFRALLSFLKLGMVLEAETAFSSSAINTTFAGAGKSGGGSWGSAGAKTSTLFNSGTGWRQTTAANDTVYFTVTVPTSHKDGGLYVSWFFLCPGASDGQSLPGGVCTFDIDGTTVYPVGYPQGTPFDTSTTRPTYSGASYSTPYWKVARIWVPADGASHQVNVTAGTGGMALDMLGVECDQGLTPPIIVNLVNQTPGSLGNSGEAAAIAALNVAKSAVIGEFRSPFIVGVDIDHALNYGDPGNVYQYWATGVDTTHPNEIGHRQIFREDLRAIDAMPLSHQQLSNCGGGTFVGILDPVVAVDTSGVTRSGSQTVDGIVVHTGDRVLRAVGNDKNDGIWIANDGGAWTRPYDFTTGAQVWGKAVVLDQSGTTYKAGMQWTLSGTGAIIVDTTAQTWVTRDVAGTTSQYVRGDNSLSTFSTDVQTYVPPTMLASINDYIAPAAQSTAFLLTESREVAIPFWNQWAWTYDRIAVWLNTVGTSGAVIRLGIRADGGNGRPGATVVLDAGTASGTGSVNTYATATINQALTANTLYWLTATEQGSAGTTAKVQSIANPFPMMGQPTWIQGGQPGGVYQSGITGALPSSWTTAGVLNTLNVAWIGLRRSA